MLGEVALAGIATLFIEAVESGAPTAMPQLCPGCPCAGFKAVLAELAGIAVSGALLESVGFTGASAVAAGKLTGLPADGTEVFFFAF